MPNKQHRGFVVPAPPDLNPKQKPDLYVFSGAEVPNGKGFICSLRVLPLPGYVPPEEFAADVTAQKPLHGTLELFEPKFDLGLFSYTRRNGDNVTAKADDARQLSMDQLRGPDKEPPEPALEQKPKPKTPTPPRSIADDFSPSF